MQTIIKYKKYLIISSALALLIFFTVLYIKEQNLKELPTPNKEISILEETTKKVSEANYFYIDIKGAVKKPGVYKFQDGSIVLDAIEKAGGLTKNGVTSNINLSQKLVNEMVIYIFNKNELKNKNVSATTKASTTCKCETIEINNCINDQNKNESLQSDNKKININNAELEELTSLSGIGESKANAIIKYRNDNGPFKSIEDIMNVSGLGEALFDKIKDNITV